VSLQTVFFATSHLEEGRCMCKEAVLSGGEESIAFLLLTRRPKTYEMEGHHFKRM